MNEKDWIFALFTAAPEPRLFKKSYQSNLLGISTENLRDNADVPIRPVNVAKLRSLTLSLVKMLTLEHMRLARVPSRIAVRTPFRRTNIVNTDMTVLQMLCLMSIPCLFVPHLPCRDMITPFNSTRSFRPVFLPYNNF
jgi:hypothetical protein